jgi:hypothetical protein
MMKVNGVKSIVRNNIFVNGNGAGIGTAPGSSARLSEYNRIFHNVFYTLGGAAWEVEAYQNDYGSPNNNEFKNNIVYKTHTKPESSKFDAEVTIAGLTKYWNDAFLNNKVLYNCMAYDAAASKQQGYTDAGKQSLTALESTYPTYFNNNKQVAPLFVKTSPQESRDDFKLSANSQCKNVGGDLTITTNSGTGKTFKVADVSYFSDGRGLISGDLIRIGSSAAVRISNVNYSKNELTVESSITWSANDGVNLNYSGSKPDIGLVEFGSSINTSIPSPPQGFIVR